MISASEFRVGQELVKKNYPDDPRVFVVRALDPASDTVYLEWDHKDATGSDRGGITLDLALAGYRFRLKLDLPPT